MKTIRYNQLMILIDALDEFIGGKLNRSKIKQLGLLLIGEEKKYLTGIYKNDPLLALKLIVLLRYSHVESFNIELSPNIFVRISNLTSFNQKLEIIKQT